MSAEGSARLAVLADSDGRTLALYPDAAVRGAPLAAERFGLQTREVRALGDNGGGALSGARIGESEQVLGVARLRDAPLYVYAIGATGFDAVAWNMTLIFHALLFFGPLFTAIAFYVVLLMQTGALKKAEARLLDSERRFRLAIEGARCGVWDWDLETDRGLHHGFLRPHARPARCGASFRRGVPAAAVVGGPVTPAHRRSRRRARR